MEKILIICQKGPFGDNSTIEAFRLGAGYRGIGEEIECSILLEDNAIRVLSNSLDSSKIGINSLDQGIEMADLTELPIFIKESELRLRKMNQSDLIDYEGLHIIKKQELDNFYSQFDLIFYM